MIFLICPCFIVLKPQCYVIGVVKMLGYTKDFWGQKSGELEVPAKHEAIKSC